MLISYRMSYCMSYLAHLSVLSRGVEALGGGDLIGEVVAQLDDGARGTGHTALRDQRRGL